MKRLLVIGLLLQTTMALGQAPGAPRANPAQQVAQRPGGYVQPHPAVARIVAPEKDGTSFGSGTLIDVRGEHALVITNWHVIRDVTGDLTVIFPDGFRSGAKLIKVDKDWDLAALAIWRPQVQPIALARVAPRQGEPLSIAGYGQGDYRMVTGRCTQYVSPRGDFPFEMVELSATARNGDSGGPIFNARGELAGVLFGANSESTAGSYCGRVAQFLSSVMPTDLPNSRPEVLSDEGWVAATDRNAGGAVVDSPAAPPAVAATAVSQTSPIAAPAPQVDEPAPVTGHVEQTAVAQSAVPNQAAGTTLAIMQQAPPAAEPAVSLSAKSVPAVAELKPAAVDDSAPVADHAAAKPAVQTASADASPVQTTWWQRVAGGNWVEQAKTVALVLTGITIASRWRKRRKLAAGDSADASDEEDDDEEEDEEPVARPRKIKISGKQAA